MSKLPEIGVRGLYRGSIPAIVGQFSRLAMMFFIFVFLYATLYMYSCFYNTCTYSIVNVAFNCSHGLRTGIFEASKLVLINFAPTLPELQVRDITRHFFFIGLLFCFAYTLEYFLHCC